MYKMLRKPNGLRVPFEETRGFKILKFDTPGENAVTITQFASGYAFKGQFKHTMTSTIYLQDLVLINVYDHRAEFFSTSSIDFTYITLEKGVNIQLINEMINDDAGIIRAQWVHQDENIDRILDEISVGRKVFMTDSFSSRPLSFDEEI